MRSTPGISMRGAPKKTRVLCPSNGCGQHVVTLPSGVRLAMRGVKATSRIEGTCRGCGASFDLPTVEEVSRG